MTNHSNNAVLGFLPRLLLLAGGCAAGYAAANYLATKDIVTPAPVIESTSQAAAQSSGSDAPQAVAKAPQEACEEAAAATRVLAKPLPAGRDPQTIPEWYQAFMSEARDESWAPLVESDIRDVIAGAPNPVQTDYLQCAGTRCTVAGYLNQQHAFDSCEIGRWAGDSLVFRDSFNYTCVDESIGGAQRFVVFFQSERAP